MSKNYSTLANTITKYRKVFVLVKHVSHYMIGAPTKRENVT